MHVLKGLETKRHMITCFSTFHFTLIVLRIDAERNRCNMNYKNQPYGLATTFDNGQRWSIKEDIFRGTHASNKHAIVT